MLTRFIDWVRKPKVMYKVIEYAMPYDGIFITYKGVRYYAVVNTNVLIRCAKTK